eukprot:CAMPEP_0176006934 /NCGR_PEP_ID=MMETSP0120_2-20121206/2975_1 /TAXON_ID=160619 /ORGANISM="Kryptoperidinium foliaceum, Strain CCMP 1326" /LENGTH=158 /DNA_ID=CAMNT_0017339683 /DNA_START=311 /DNA_END=784 /DNA_ORIENTATION=-
MKTAIYFTVLSSLLSLWYPLPVHSHRPAIQGGNSCGDDFGSSADALSLPDPSIRWSFRHYLDCTHQAVWINFESSEPEQIFSVSVGVPSQDRFADIRANALIIGRGLPPLSDDDWFSLPEQVQNDTLWEENPEYGALYLRSPQDRSKCDHVGPYMAAE